jgi:signal transduction histidine kinase
VIPEIVDPRIAALIAGAAFGANLLGTGLLLLINPRSRSLRWYAAFNVVLLTWLGLQGWFMVAGVSPGLFLAYGAAVHLLPAFFVAAALVDARDAPARYPLLAIAAGVVTLLLMPEPLGSPFTIPWQTLAWGSGAAVHATAGRNRPPRGGAAARGERLLTTMLLVLVPLGVIGAFLLRGAFIFYGLPLMTIGIQFLIFVGVVHHRFYDIEVRAARSGEIASRAAEQERLALVGELAASLAHEVRNPLTGIRSLAQRLGSADMEAERRRRYADVILEEIGRLDRIVSNLLDVARRGDRTARLTAGPVPLAPLFDDLALLVESRARAADVRLRTRSDGVVVSAAREPLAQVLLNLLLNAIVHSPAGGTIRLEARPNGASARITVGDQGPGVPAADRDTIFEPFRTTGLGAGLGLAVVRRLARDWAWPHGVRDAPGTGAEFWIDVPLARAGEVDAGGGGGVDAGRAGGVDAGGGGGVDAPRSSTATVDPPWDADGS